MKKLMVLFTGFIFLNTNFSYANAIATKEKDSVPKKTRDFTNKYVKAVKNQSNLPSINTISLKESQNLPMEEFMVMLEKSDDDIKDEGRRNIMQFAKNKNLEMNRRFLLLDSLKSLGSPLLFNDLITLYKSSNNKEELPLKNQIMPALQSISQSYLRPNQYTEETRQLNKFYLEILMRESPSSRDHAIAAGGFILYNSDEEINNSMKKFSIETREKIKNYRKHTNKLYAY